MDTPSSPTPLERAPEGLAAGNADAPIRALFLKREDTHELGAFKWRGAIPTVEQYRQAGAATVVTASTGNQGAAVAWACRRAGLDAVIYGPTDCAEAKLGLIRAQGGQIVLSGGDLDEAKDAARQFAETSGHAFFEDGAEPAQFEGYGTIAREILAQLEAPPSAVVVPVGNGALMIGVGKAFRALAPETELVGAVAAAAPVMAESVAAKRPLESEHSATFADGLAVRVAIPLAVDELVGLGCRLVEVSERALADAVGAYDGIGIRAEGAAAAALAAVPLVEVDGVVVLIVTGRNIDDELHERAVQAPATFAG